jgi:hypothetical protein
MSYVKARWERGIWRSAYLNPALKTSPDGMKLRGDAEKRLFWGSKLPGTPIAPLGRRDDTSRKETPDDWFSKTRD